MNHLKKYEGIFSDHVSHELSQDWSAPKPIIDVVSNVSNENDNWYGLYVNGNLVIEGDRLNYRDVIRALGFTFRQIELNDEQLKHLGYRCPKTFKEAQQLQKRKISPDDPYGEETWD